MAEVSENRGSSYVKRGREIGLTAFDEQWLDREVEKNGS
jgi:hypothetical protein